MLNVHPFIYIIPLTSIVARKASEELVQIHPLVVFQLLLLISAVYRPYPDLCQLTYAVTHSLVQVENLSRIRFLPLYLFGTMIPLSLLPLMLHLWIKTETGNANYFYFQNLIFLLFFSGYILRLVDSTFMRLGIARAFAKQQSA